MGGATKTPHPDVVDRLTLRVGQGINRVGRRASPAGVGVINLQHRQPHTHSQREIQPISTIGFLVGAEIETARLETENSQLFERLETRKLLDRAKGILQRDLGVTEEDAYLTIRGDHPGRRAAAGEGGKLTPDGA